MRRLRFIMPAPADVVFEAFHDHRQRLLWDTLLSEAYVEGGATHPSIGAVSVNRGRGLRRCFVLRTRFVNVDPPRRAAAVLVEPSGPFQHWAATLQHHDLDAGCSELLYSFDLSVRPRWLGRWVDASVAKLFERATRRRFAALASYLQSRADPDRA
ncbi:SRPBCC family protein [Pseudomonas sp. NY15181]|uniref:SRPBCC family protein n=1 Tax=Pseudomonas sp. NY15181 TaxID=3400349 RepID=UPI003A867BC1